jgi:hypothetical protein
MEENSTPPVKLTSKQTLATISTILVIALIMGFCIYYYQKNTAQKVMPASLSSMSTAQLDPGAEWKTLTSKTGWSIQYPSEYSATSCNACDIADMDVFVNFFPASALGATNLLQLRIYPSKEFAKQSLQDMLGSLKSENQRAGFRLVSSQDITISGFPALDIVYVLTNDTEISADQDQIEQVYIKTPQNMYNILTITTDGGHPGNNREMQNFANYQIIKKMLATVKIEN